MTKPEISVLVQEMVQRIKNIEKGVDHMKLSMPEDKKTHIIYADLQKNRYSDGFSLIVKKCELCKMEHIHSGEEGHRSAHCFDKKTGKALPVDGYTLKIDWSNKKNAALREEYETFMASKNK